MSRHSDERAHSPVCKASTGREPDEGCQFSGDLAGDLMVMTRGPEWMTGTHPLISHPQSAGDVVSSNN